MAKKKLPNVDGLGPKDIKRIRTMLRQAWRYSYAHKLVVQRCLGSGGFSYCEKCKKRAPKVFIDHIKKVGNVDEGFISRLWCSSKHLQGLCKTCHDKKTKEERAHEKEKHLDARLKI